ncbi:MAG: CPBP family intramembrane glutamic endopeptidase [Devosia sp.]
MPTDTHPESNPNALTVFGVLAIPPILFLIATVAFAFYFGSQGAAPEQIAVLTQTAAPWILVVTQILLLGLVVILSRGSRDLGWKLPRDKTAWIEALVGAAWGIGLGFAYVLVLAPALTWLQANLGDYVPAGSVLPTVGASLVPFFIGDVLLAPFVEEWIYRGWATSRLLLRYGALPTALIVCVAFGLLHWAGGIWYMLLVGGVAGGLFITLRLARRNLIAPFAAHLGLNAVEYLSVFLGH